MALNLPRPTMSRSQFYATHWVRQAIVDQCRHRYVTIRYDREQYPMARHYSKRELAAVDVSKLWGPETVNIGGKDKTAFIELHEAQGQVHDPMDINYFIHRHAVEFIPEVSTIFDLDRSDTLIIDIDPKGPIFTWDDLCDSTNRVIEAVIVSPPLLEEGYKIKNWKLRFSGNRSFHIYIKLEAPAVLKEVRETVKRALDPFVTETFTYRNKRNRDDFILVDIGAIARHRCVRAALSVHAKTGLVCIPVNRDADLKKWDFHQALPENVIQLGRLEEVF